MEKGGCWTISGENKVGQKRREKNELKEQKSWGLALNNKISTSFFECETF